MVQEVDVRKKGTLGGVAVAQLCHPLADGAVTEQAMGRVSADPLVHPVAATGADIIAFILINERKRLKTCPRYLAPGPELSWCPDPCPELDSWPQRCRGSNTSKQILPSKSPYEHFSLFNDPNLFCHFFFLAIPAAGCSSAAQQAAAEEAGTVVALASDPSSQMPL